MPLLVVALLFTSPQGRAAEGRQRVEGTILLPAPGTDPAGCNVNPARRLASLGAGNGIVGYKFDIDRATWGKRFVLRPRASAFLEPDLDLTLYYRFPTREEALADPIGGGTAYYEHIETRRPGGERGLIRAGAKVAIVCIYGGPSVTGAMVPFVYTTL